MVRAQRIADGIAVHAAHTKVVPIEKVCGNPRNPNTHPASQIELLAKIINAQGWRAPITVSNRSGYVVRGHGRLAAARLLGVSEVPIDYQDYATEAEEYADMIADNRIAELAEIDGGVLKDLILDIDTGDIDIELTGFTEAELARMMSAVGSDVVEDEAPDPPAEPVTCPGAVWLLGEHRVMCGDSTKAEDVARLMGGKRADVCLTDPPYGLGDTVSEKNDYATYDDSLDNLVKLVGGFVPLAQANSKTVVLTPGNKNQHIYPKPTWTMAWFMPAGVGRGPWGFCCWQPILCYGKDPKLAKGKGSHPDAIVHTETSEKFGHPCTKPINFWTWLMARVSEPGELIYDPFSGSGTTHSAAEQSGRICYGMELDPAYCDVIVQRWENLTGRKAVLEDGQTHEAHS